MVAYVYLAHSDYLSGYTSNLHGMFWLSRIACLHFDTYSCVDKWNVCACVYAHVWTFQEELRFTNPHKAYTFDLHGYESVVGPVKGVFEKESNMNKAREHVLLVSDRPAFVTILTLGQ